jgi:hypothetical protein
MGRIILERTLCGISNSFPSDVSQRPESGRRELKCTFGTPFRFNCQQERASHLVHLFDVVAIFVMLVEAISFYGVLLRHGPF